MTGKYNIDFISEKCVQCFACEAACKSWRDLEPGMKYRTVRNIWHGAYPEVRSSSQSISCMHCEDPACMEACPASAISIEDGIVLVDTDKCTGCRLCYRACPVKAPQFGSDRKMRKCDLCTGLIDHETETPPCVSTCPTGALVLTGRQETR